MDLGVKSRDSSCEAKTSKAEVTFYNQESRQIKRGRELNNTCRRTRGTEEEYKFDKEEINTVCSFVVSINRGRSK